MKKTVIAIGAALSISGVLAGCGATNTAAPNAATDNVRMRNVGYYTDQGLNYRDARLQTYRNAQHADRFNQGVGRDTNNVAPYTEPLSYESSNTALARRIATRVDQIKGIRSSQVIVTRQRVVVGANVSNRAANTPKLHRQIKSAVTPYAAGRTIQITTDRDVLLGE
ncbi:YhcN/YlaJ family sporulation lipoprotein [Terrilactibacillus sp. S3-3]|nr:YhcN/YlaJ family sporulation lipoprotein [Terrilactibacillus sp. S3-3]